MFKFSRKDFGRSKPTSNNSNDASADSISISNSSSASSWFPHLGHHPDLPLSTGASQSQAKSPTPRLPQALNRSVSVNDRAGIVGGSPADRRSIAVFPSTSISSDFPSPNFDEFPSNGSRSGGSLGRSQTVFRSGSSSRTYSPVYEDASTGVGPSPQWTPDPSHLPTPTEHAEPEFVDAVERLPMPMSAAQQQLAGKISSDSGQQAALDRWSQRRLQRLQTESAFRDQRQTGVQSPQTSDYNSSASGSAQFANNSKYGSSADAQPQQNPQTPHAAGIAQGSFRTSQASQPAQQSLQGLAIQTQPDSTNTSRQNSFPREDVSGSSQQQQQSQQAQQPQSSSQHNHHHHHHHLSTHHASSPSQHNNPQAYSPHDAAPAQFSSHQQQDPSRPSLGGQSRSFSHHHPSAAGPQDVSDAVSSMSTNVAAIPAKSSARTATLNRQSMHNGLGVARDVSNVSSSAQGQPGLPVHNASGAGGQGQQQQRSGDVGRGTPQPAQATDEMTDEEVAQLVKDHKELREKYTKVKKYYFEKEDQVKQLQNSLAHQRLSQSRTSLDDSEYTTRFNRLDGLVAQLSFSIRKSWRSIPAWLHSSVNKDAVATGKQEMTAAGRAFISCWLVDEVFDKYFHPDLEIGLSAQLKSVQKNIRKYAPISTTAEEEDYLTTKTVNWRLATLEGLQDALRSPQCPTNRQQLTDQLKNNLVSAISVYLQDPPPADLEGGVHMIVELVVSIAIHLPLESRDVVIEYFSPGNPLSPEQMKIESGIPALTLSIADDANDAERAERMSLRSATSDGTDLTNADDGAAKKAARGMLHALTGTGNKTKGNSAQGKHAAAGGSSSSLHRPESAQGMKEDPTPRVRMAAGIGVQVRGRSVLVKAPVFST